ncbi:carbonic anhydrase 4-like [Dendropsophus ebraccatus]|uniref:carbonic anhydrase 4-like n=1 Tax=Dendropsophus ebraccatus TaxID=150705 RepID=UPI003831B431
MSWDGSAVVKKWVSFIELSDARATVWVRIRVRKHPPSPPGAPIGAHPSTPSNHRRPSEPPLLLHGNRAVPLISLDSGTLLQLNASLKARTPAHRIADPQAPILHPARDWCYTEEACGPSTWASLGSCNGSRQSPIDIPEASVLFNASLSQLVFVNYSNNQSLQTISNNGHTVEISISNGVSLSGGGLPSTYVATAFHFHWGNGRLGSEHRLSGKQYPMEMHIVHIKEGMNLSQAKQDPSGIAVLGFFIDIMNSTTKSRLAVLCDRLDSVSTPGTTLPLNVNISLADLLGEVNLGLYYRYKGSLTTPTCEEAVLWTIFKTPITIPSNLVNIFSSAVKHNVSGSLETLQNNFRSPQPLSGRSVQASFSSSVAPSTSRAGSPSTTLSVVLFLLLLLTR